MISPPIFTLPNTSGHISVDADVCNVQISCVLLQQQTDGTTKPIGYWFRSLIDTERKYGTTERDYLAIVGAVLLQRPYLKDAQFAIHIDNDSLMKILNSTNKTGRHARWRLRLPEIDFEVIHLADVKHQAADVLTHSWATGDEDAPLEDGLPLLAVDEKGASISTLVINANSNDRISLNAQKKISIDTPSTLEKPVTKQTSTNTAR